MNREFLNNTRAGWGEGVLRVVSSLGRVRPHIVKKVAKDLMTRFPNKFADDFDFNKQLVGVLTNVSSRNLRNRIAGYVTHLARLAQSSEGTPRQVPRRHR